jgi:Tfp pilus assembly protein PilV
VKIVKCGGFSFIEVMIACFLLSFTMMGFMIFQIEMLKNSHHLYLQSIATIQANNLSERLKANHSSTLLNRELDEWNQQNRDLLPDGIGKYQCSLSHCEVDLQWRENKLQQLKFLFI